MRSLGRIMNERKIDLSQMGAPTRIGGGAATPFHSKWIIRYFSASADPDEDAGDHAAFRLFLKVGDRLFHEMTGRHLSKRLLSHH